jgi:hypothetical protein
MNNMGRTTPAQQRDGSHYAALAHQPEWFTYYPGPQFDASPVDPRTLNFNFAGRTHHMHSTPVNYHIAGRQMVFCWGENSQLRAWDLLDSGELVFLGAGDITASVQQPGMSGGMIIASGNPGDSTSGVVWGCVPYLDANRVVSPGRLVAYSATNIQGGLELLWDSERWGIGFAFSKFNVPTVSGGRLFVPTYNATIDVYGLTPR